MDSSRLRAITGMNTLSSKLPCDPQKAMAASLPITWAPTWVTASHRTGFTLPGMIDEPGCRSGRWISPRPVLGPLAIQRRSLAILMRPTAAVRTWPDASTSASRDDWAATWSAASVSGRPVRLARRLTTSAPNPAGALRPVPTAVPPMGSSPSRGSELRSRRTDCVTWVA